MEKKIFDGKLIVLEGIDGAGTTTQAHMLVDYLKSQRRLVHFTRQPSTGPIGSALRLALSGRLKLGAGNQAQTMALLFAADRLDHLAHDVEPMLRDGYIVICDRYDLSSLVYQSATAVDSSEEGAGVVDWLRTINRFAIRPDATVILHTSPEEAERRRNNRSGSEELYERQELQVRLAQLYRGAKELVPGDRIFDVDGDQTMQEVAARIQTALASFLH
jgi:dTMP kinase